MKLAAIDIGSNSIKLVVVDAAGGDSFAVLAREKEPVRLGQETLRQEHLSDSAIERAADCISRFRSIAEARGAEQVIAVATASVREADNAAQFISEIARRTRVQVEVLSSIEEARLIGLAVSRGCVHAGASLINIDIGGGSTEISLVQDGVPKQLFSVKLGAVGLTERFITSDPVKPKELRALRNEIAAALERPSRELREATWQHATGTSGTILAIGEVLRLRLMKSSDHKSQAAQPAGAEIPLNQLERLNNRLAEMEISERRGQPGISNQRSEIIIAGGQILEGAMRALGINVMRTCDWALREGAIIDRLGELEAEALPPVPDIADHRLRGVHALGRRFGYEEAHAFQVARLAESIFDQLAPLYKLARRERILLSAASLLHDIGYHIAHESHHKHSLYLIKCSELTGFSEAERLVIANIARYHRGQTPRERHADYALLNQSERETVGRLAAILRISDALDKSYDSRVREVRCIQSGQMLQMRLKSSLGCEKEILAAEQKRDLFESAFNCKLSFSNGAFAKRA